MRASIFIASFVALAASAPLELPSLPVDLPALPEFPSLPVDLPTKRAVLSTPGVPRVPEVEIVDLDIEAPEVPTLPIDAHVKRANLPALPELGLPEPPKLPELHLPTSLPIDLPVKRDLGM